jgi:translation elongation factor EF-G
MNKVIIYTSPDGNLCVVHPAPDISLEEVIACSVPEGVEAQVIDAADLPQDRYFRNAWKNNDTGIEIDVPAAQEVQRNQWRKLRKAKLADLDMEVMKAMEKGDTKRRNEIAEMKQALRDVTLSPLPNTLEEIKTTIPEILL